MGERLDRAGSGGKIFVGAALRGRPSRNNRKGAATECRPYKESL
jgi:hypothetical protein